MQKMIVATSFLSLFFVANLFAGQGSSRPTESTNSSVSAPSLPPLVSPTTTQAECNTEKAPASPKYSRTGSHMTIDQKQAIEWIELTNLM